MRHRRRCQGPRKLMNRRKACDACVQAKAKCCYTQPTCSRCTKRGMQCVYVASSATSLSDHSDQQTEVVEAPHSNLPSLPPSLPQMENLATSNQLFDLELPAWDFSAHLQPQESFYMTLADLADAPPFTGSDLTAPEPPMVHESSDFTPSSQVVSQSPVPNDIPEPTPLGSYSDSASFTTASTSSWTSSSTSSSISSTASFSTSSVLVHVLTEYPSLLTKSSFSSPFLHLSLYSLYSNVDPDMTFLPMSSMAICCGSGIILSDDKRFFRRAMETARQRLIESFVSATEPQLCPDQMLSCQLAYLPMHATMGWVACHANL
jgi:hypothetical protein